MKVEVAYPPNIEEIAKVFPLAKEGPILFAWGNVIYNPKGVPIANHLLAHELTHGIRQGKDIEGWWAKYLTDPDFRYREELAAHKVEFMAQAELVTDRNLRAKILLATATKLASPLYGKMHPTRKCMEDIQRAIVD